MKVKAMLAQKGSGVVTLRPDATISSAIRMLKLEGIGALAVSADGAHLQGIISERDIVHGLVAHGAEVLQMRVAELMTAHPDTIAPGSAAIDALRLMQDGDYRHLPVVDGGKLCGIISIGDVVKNRLEDLETEANVLRDYIVSRG